jgi:hypothetical protein
MRLRLQSLAVSKLELFFHDIPLGPATGFIYKYGQSIALVSNWHVFSGVNPLTGNIRNTDGLCPDRPPRIYRPKRPFKNCRCWCPCAR